MRSFVAVAALLLAAPAAGAQTVTVEQPWARATAPQAQAGAVYATLTAATADRLTGASTPVAASVQVHENIHDNGVVRMRELECGLPLEPGKPVTLAPGGYHLMLMRPHRAIHPGDKVLIKFHFDSGPVVSVPFEVRAGS